MAFTVTANSLYNEIQYTLMEPRDGGVTYPSGLYTPSEVADRLNHRLREFYKRTAVVVTRDTAITTLANTRDQNIPVDVIDIIRLGIDAGCAAPCPDITIAKTQQDAWTDNNSLLDNWIIGTMFFTPIGTVPFTGTVGITAGAPNRLTVGATGGFSETTSLPLFVIPNQIDHTQVSKKNQYAQALLRTFTGSTGSKLVGPAALISYTAGAGGGGSWYMAGTDRVNGLRMIAWNAGTYRVLASGFTVAALDTVRIEVVVGGGSNSIKIFKNGVQQGSTIVDSDATRPTTGVPGLIVAIFSDGAGDVSEWNDFDGGAL